MNIISSRLLAFYNNFMNKMGGCAGCMGPSRRDENYRVNRLTEKRYHQSRVSV